MCQQSIVDLIDIREVVDRIALRVFVVDAVLIIKDRVEAYIAKAGDAAHPNPYLADNSRAA